MRYTFLLISFIFSLQVLAQSSLSTKSKKAIELYTTADNFRVRGQVKQAIDLLNQAIEKDKKFAEAYCRLGQTYKSIKQYKKAVEYYEKGLSLLSDVSKRKNFVLEIGEAYFATGDYDYAEQYLHEYVNNELNSLQNKAKIDFAKKMLANIVFARANKELAKKFKQQKLSDTVNAFNKQYFPVLTADQRSLVFTRRVGNRDADDEDIVMSQRNTNGSWSSPISISNKINTNLNEGTCSISADGRKIIFTSCVGRDGWGSCDLYESKKIGAEWTTPKNLGQAVNSPDWESQPSLSADGRTLYFVSDRRGGLGRRDIWISIQDTKGNWGKARNLGKEVNTVYDEISPFIHANNRTLYFASNGLTGFGGYDIYYRHRDVAGKWSDAQNIGAPINNHEDQFSLFITTDGSKAYYSHEEVNEYGAERSFIYETLIPESQQIEQKSNYVKGIIRDKETKQPLIASVELISINSDTLEALTESDSVSGEYLMVLTKGTQYALYVNSNSYLFQSLNFDYTLIEMDEPVIINFDLEKIKKGSSTVLSNIFFEFNKYNLQPNSIPELEKVVRFLKDNPYVKIEIGGHTDNVGTAEYNLQLSKKRADEVASYLTGSGIPQSRVSSKGFGFTQPRTDNNSENTRKLNRRIDFRIR
jgi:OmpA-OmpF porin, OOP family